MAEREDRDALEAVTARYNDPAAAEERFLRDLDAYLAARPGLVDLSEEEMLSCLGHPVDVDLPAFNKKLRAALERSSRV